MKSKRELVSIAINHSADINYKYFEKIYREHTKETFSFLTSDTTLSQSDSSRFINLFLSYKNDSH